MMDEHNFPPLPQPEVDLSEYQIVANLVSAWQTTVDDTHYPSEKLVSDAIYANKTKKVGSSILNYPIGMTFWRSSVEGFDSNNPFTPNDMPNNSYTYASGSYFQGFAPDDSSILAAKGYFLYKFVSRSNANISLIITVGTGTRTFIYGQKSTASGSYTFVDMSQRQTPSIMMFGDSITRGINSDAGSPGDQSHNVWSAVNIPDLMKNELPGWNIDNYGIGSIGWLNSGDATKGTAVQYLQRVNDADWFCTPENYENNKFIGTAKPWSAYNAIYLAFGCNDRAIDGTATQLGSLDDIDDTMTYEQVMAMTPTSIVEAMYQCYRYIRNAAPNIEIIIADPLMVKGGTAPRWSYPTRYSASSWSWDELNAMYASFCYRYGISHISNYDAPINRVDPNQSLKDNVHPSTDCYRHLARYLAGKISALIK